MSRGASTLVDLILRHPDRTFGWIAQRGAGYDADAQRRFDHPDFTAKRIWVQRTGEGAGLDYWYAYAGRPARTAAGGQ
jgi:hypothetical protein